MRRDGRHARPKANAARFAYTADSALKTLKHILARYTAFLWAILQPLGVWGVFVIAAIDGSFIGLPMDAVVAGYVYNDRTHMLLYVFLACAGSAVGSSILYLIGYFGGETLLRKRMSAARFEKIHGAFDRHEFWALMFPAMLPPPTPFKLFVLGAAAFEMNFGRFLLAIFLGRFVRFLLLSVLTVRFGPGVVHLTATLFQRHLGWTLAALGAGLIAGVLVWQRRKGRMRSLNG
jgi:membrane protein YqaA with SNARE-associated domain